MPDITKPGAATAAVADIPDAPSGSLDLTPSEIRRVFQLVKSGKLSMDDVTARMTDMSPQTQDAVRKASPVYIKPTAVTSQGAMGEFGEYLGELATGKGPARGEVADYAKREVKGALNAANPVNMVKGAYNAVRHPIDTGTALVQGAQHLAADPVGTLTDPETVGGALASAAIPAVTGSVRTMMGKVGNLLATSEKAQNATNAIGGTVAGYTGMDILTGGKGGFIGGIMGRNLLKDSTIPKRVGEALQRLSGEAPPASLSNAPANATGTSFTSMGPMTPKPGAPSVTFSQGAASAATGGGWTPEELAWLKKNHFSDDQIASMAPSAKAPAPVPPNSVRVAPPAPKSPAPPTSGSVPTANAPAAAGAAPAMPQGQTPKPPPPTLDPTAQAIRDQTMSSAPPTSTVAPKVPAGQPQAPAAPELPEAWKAMARPRPQRAPAVPSLADFTESVRSQLARLKGRQHRPLTDNDKITIINAYQSGNYNIDEVAKAAAEKSSNRQALHVDEYYRNKREPPE